MKRWIVVLAVLSLFGVAYPVTATTESPSEIPVKGMVTMVDLGADKCIPCKLMAPVLEKLKKEYDGRAAIVFIDVWKTPDEAKKFGIRAIPTQIFFDKEGKEAFRHTGYFDEKSIVAVLEKLGVK